MATIEISEDEYFQHTHDYDGICTECGNWRYGLTEPDVREYQCADCGAHAVMGTEQALLEGFLEFE